MRARPPEFLIELLVRDGRREQGSDRVEQTVDVDVPVERVIVGAERSHGSPVHPKRHDELAFDAPVREICERAWIVDSEFIEGVCVDDVAPLEVLGEGRKR